MMDWKKHTLKEITTKIGSGSTPTGGKSAYKESGTTLIRSLNIYDFKFKYKDLAFIDDAQAKKLSNVIIEENDILLNITGASVCRCTTVPNHLLPARINQHVAIIRPIPEKADYLFVLYSLNSPNIKAQLLNIAQTGATREALTKDDIEKFKIPLPPLPIQQKIATTLSTYDDLIENNQKRIAILEKMAQNLYQEWFVRFRFPDWEKVEFVEGLPKGWENVKLRSLSNLIKRGITPTYDENGDSLVINQRCIRNNSFNINVARRQIKRIPKEKMVKFGDVLVNSTGTGTLGRVTQLMQNIANCTVDTHVTIIRPSDKVNVDFWGYLLMSKKPFFENLAIGATNQTELPREDIGLIKVISPPLEIQNQFSKIVRPLRKQISILKNKNENIKQTRDRLLPRLLSGKLKV